MAGDTSGTTRELDQTPTWAVAGVCAVIILISIALEKILHKLGTVINSLFTCLFFQTVTAKNSVCLCVCDFCFVVGVCMCVFFFLLFLEWFVCFSSS